MATQQGGAEIRTDDKAPTLTAAAGMSGNNQPVICIATGQGGAEITKGISPTLNCNHEQPIICLMDQGGSVMETLLDKAGTLRAQEHGHQPVILQLYENHGQDSRITGPLEIAPTVAQKFGTGGNNTPLVLAFKAGNGAKAGGLGIQEEVSPTMTSSESGTNQVPVVMAVDCRNGTVDPDVNGTLQAKSSGGQSLNLNNVVPVGIPSEPVSFDLVQITSKINRSAGSPGVAYTLAARSDPIIVTTNEDGTIPLDGQPCVIISLCVRRLTPMECERLQGFPDGWTDIGPWTDSKGKVHKESSDSARYKALGNSIALPPWKWILKRISAQYERDATMASLFDGIGGFPFLWEQINGKGSCLWASEIEEFPIAVTRLRFGEEAAQ